MRSRENSSRERFCRKRYARLEAFIDLANLAPATDQPEEREQAWRAAYKLFGPRPTDPPEIRAQIGEAEMVLIRGDNPNWPYPLASSAVLCEAARAVHQALYTLVSTAPGTLPVSLSLPAAPLCIQVMPNGAMLPGLDLFRDFLLPALRERDVSRIKICSASGCGRLFLATRKNRAVCSAICGERLKAAAFRKDHPNYYSRAERKKRKRRAARRRLSHGQNL
jgi:CGNR zinc finger